MQFVINNPGCSRSTISDAGPGDATSGWGVTPIMQRSKAASLSIFLVIEQKEGTICGEDHSLAGCLDWLTTVLTTSLLKGVNLNFGTWI